ncbi:hypothetical protein BLA60_23270 [Actinophytocola xinjiangensis]|uniref:DUF2568 domain-containing protein n=1 Tax=Actinophytocola xinjiangensis TaxID=485602 RepID=A0A7Z0WIW0_9PSEU|nr:YrdB family protein [Actinophytocola xinjiangensis]OLF08352.1 hypothetical protein BLA60_23270 [Actinophytocola xinjiangensis]
MNNAVRWSNDILAFVLELGALGALCYWGFATGSTVLTKLLLGLGAPLLAAVAWGLFAAPKATFAVPLVAVLVVKAAVFGAAALALYVRGHRTLAIGFAVVVVVNTVIVTIARANES